MIRIFKKNIVLFILITAINSTCSYAATITVTNLNDTGAGSLRQAIITANSDVVQDEIVFTTSLTGTITLASNLPTITNSLIITGLGVDQLTVNTVQVVNTNGEITTTKTNFVNKNGALNTNKGLTRSGEFKITKSN
jgi:hypothetical protein